ILEMRRLATVRPSDWFHVIGPPPAGLEDEPTDLTVADFDDLGSTIGKRAGFVRRLKAAVFCRLHKGRSPFLVICTPYLLVSKLSTCRSASPVLWHTPPALSANDDEPAEAS